LPSARTRCTLAKSVTCRASSEPNAEIGDKRAEISTVAAGSTRTAQPPGSIESYSGCRRGAEMISHMREGTGHSWPKDATSLIWASFEKHPMP